MESVGQQLRNARLRRGLALDDVSASTRINPKCIQAIESDDLGPINSVFFYKSFVRQIADCVGADQGQLAPAIQSVVSGLPEPLVPGQAGAPVRPDLPGLRPQRTRKARWLVSVGSLFVMLFACSNLYDAWQKSRIAPQKSESLDQPAQNPAAVEPASEAVRVRLSALERTWLSVSEDGRQVFDGTLKAAEIKTLEGRNTARVRTDNAGGIEVVFNGQTIGPLGRKGEVRTVVFTRNGYNFTEPRDRMARGLFAANPLAVIPNLTFPRFPN